MIAADELARELERLGDLHVLGPGRIAVGGRLLAVMEYFDEKFRALGRRAGAVPQDYPDLMSVERLERVEFLQSFPHLATYAAPFESHTTAGSPRLAEPKHVLAPAVCYHTYACLEGRRIPSEPYVVSARGRCCRFEGELLEGTPARLWSFTMREIVCVGADAEVEALRSRLSRSVVRLARGHGLACTLEPSSDPFFLPESRGKALAQRLNQTKLELRTPLGDGREMALASFNLHGDFFGRRMKIELASGGPARSGCTAFGLERWGFAFLQHNGVDPSKWPDSVRRRYERS